ncbi:hypothetical protein [Anaerosporobacter faecicola]|uniref:hypothetical protein n=1 Tax=Anaerosporobacter faecicola TaxID=2718714 RepID=UPI001439187A|nr:hypothetical protein [Anaerosporobacter faecicola]
MKERVMKALEFGVSLTIGMLIVNVVMKDKIGFIDIIVTFVVSMIVDFIFSIIGDKIKRTKAK